MGYGIATHSSAQRISNTLATILIITVLSAILTNRPRTYVILLAIPIVFLTFTLMIPSSILSTVLLAFSATRVPQVVKSWQTWKTGIPSAASIHTWSLSGLSAGLWFIYGFLDHRSIVEITSVIGIILTAIILGFELASYRENGIMALAEPIGAGE